MFKRLLLFESVSLRHREQLGSLQQAEGTKLRLREVRLGGRGLGEQVGPRVGLGGGGRLELRAVHYLLKVGQIILIKYLICGSVLRSTGSGLKKIKNLTRMLRGQKNSQRTLCHIFHNSWVLKQYFHF